MEESPHTASLEKGSESIFIPNGCCYDELFHTV